MKHDARWLVVGLSLLAGCGDGGDGGASGEGAGARGLSQPGAQDFGLFRQILEDGGIPGLSTLDDVGFAAEHKLALPPPDCGQTVCVSAQLGVRGNMITGDTCTILQIGLSTALDPDELERPPLHLVLAIDASGSMAGDSITFVKAGLAEMLDELSPDDRISLVRYADDARVVLEAVPLAQRELIEAGIDAISPSGKTNLYAGVHAALDLASTHGASASATSPGSIQQSRVIVLSDGVANTGLVSLPKLRALAAGYAAEGIGITTIGVGTEFDVEAMRQLAEVGAGSFYFLEDPRAVKEVFTEEARTFLWPVATDVQLDLDVGDAYRLAGVFGTHGFVGGTDGGRVHLPVLFLAGRSRVDEVPTEGRRGGGGAIMIELVPRAAGSETLPGADPFAVGAVELSFRDPVSGEAYGQSVNVAAPFGAGLEPDDGYFEGQAVDKGFVMLNVFAAFEQATTLARDSDLFMARRTLEALRPNVRAWLDQRPDPDLEDDLRYVNLFIANLTAAEDVTDPYVAVEPPNPWPAD